MLLAISTTHHPATDLGYLLHKHPDRFQSFELSFGEAHVFYPESTEQQCTACLMLDIDPVGMARNRRRNRDPSLSQYVNDRPWVASSFMSTAIAQVWGTALSGRCKGREALAATPLPLQVEIHTLPVKGGAAWIERMFQPLGYEVEARPHALDETFPHWGDSHYHTVRLKGNLTLSQLLNHLYVLIPVFDNYKHYFVGDDEMEKLLAKGEGWLASHPEKESIARRYLRFQPSLFRQALARLIDEDADATEELGLDSGEQEEKLEESVSLNTQRLASVVEQLTIAGASRVLDLGCGEGKLIRELMKKKQFKNIVGMDVSYRTLENAARRLKLDRLPPRQAERIELLHGSLMYRDQRWADFDAAALVEVIEHLDPPRLAAMERVVFEHARPGAVIITTPNSEYNVMWESLPAGQFRHADHRFEWTRGEFQEWAAGVSERFDYNVEFHSIGPIDANVGSPTQMAVFEQREDIFPESDSEEDQVTSGSTTSIVSERVVDMEPEEPSE